MRRTPNSFTDGSPVPIKPSDRTQLTKPYGSFSAPCQLTTGMTESESAGAALIFLAAQRSGWHRVPWRFLRNAYMDYGAAEREAFKQELVPPTSMDAASIQSVSGKFESIFKLVTGLEHLLARELILRIEDKGEVYFLPTDRLLACVRTT